MYKYIHDIENRIVYRHPEEPNVQEEKDRKGNRIGWWISMTVDITKAENRYITISGPIQLRPIHANICMFNTRKK